MEELTFALRGPGGEPVDLWRTFVSHGVASLPPMRVNESARTFEVTLRVGGRPRTLCVGQAGGRGRVSVSGRRPTGKAAEATLAAVKHVLRFDEDLSEFYARAIHDPALQWVSAGAGRMVRSPSVFEEVAKTICTTNCAWSATQRMVSALVEHLGERAPGAPVSGPWGRAFPTPEAMGEADDAFYKDVARAGYRGPYLRSLAVSVAAGEIDLEALGNATRDELSDDEIEATLLALPGVGPYAAAHIMMMLGRYSRLILDSWTRPTYARLARRRTVTDDAIVRRFRKYGPYAGLAFWLFLTRDWVSET